MTLTREETIERLKQNKAAAEFYASQSRITAEIENALKDSEAFDRAIEALSADTVSREFYEDVVKANHGLAKELANLKEEFESADAEFTDLPDIPRYYYEKVVGKMAHEINTLKGQLESAETHEIRTETHGVCSDLISRADAIELLTKIVFDEPPYLDSETLCRMYAEEQINALPSADAAEVVRCKECIHYESDGGAMMICNITDMVCDNDDYCSYCERREESEVEE